MHRLLVAILIGLLGFTGCSSIGEQASSVEEEVAEEKPASSEEEDADKETTVIRHTVVYQYTEPTASQAPMAATDTSAPQGPPAEPEAATEAEPEAATEAEPVTQSSGITPEQEENRRRLEECQRTYDGTGPSCWVQDQIRWAQEQGLSPSPNINPARSEPARTSTDEMCTQAVRAKSPLPAVCRNRGG